MGIYICLTLHFMGVKVLTANIYGELFGAKYLSENLTHVSSLFLTTPRQGVGSPFNAGRSQVPGDAALSQSRAAVARWGSLELHRVVLQPRHLPVPCSPPCSPSPHSQVMSGSPCIFSVILEGEQSSPAGSVIRGGLGGRIRSLKT